MAIRFLDDITSDSSVSFADGVSAQDFYAMSGHLMNSLCAVSAVLSELIASDVRSTWNNTATIVSVGANKWDSVYAYVNASSGIELNQELTTTFVINNSADIVSANDMVLRTPYIITDGGFV